ncbi:unnamed protein product [Allacma fusca]|uniref:C-type lectin domain-containing protein n=1 Tax=Allacma fusca TaxID=39272 RepID=A0A8J2LKS9_9HEXA|nr:unnamed protein product [Allacma fusca]
MNGEFYWEDKSEFKYTFWSAESDLKNGCAGISSGPANPKGNWHTESCTNVNSVVCQKRQSWSSVKLQTLLMEMTDEMTAAKREIQETKSKLAFVQQELETTKLELEEAKDNLLKSTHQISDLHEKHNSTGSLLQDFLTTEMDSLKHDIGIFKKQVIDVKNSSDGLTRQMVTVAGKIVQVETNMEIMKTENSKSNTSLSAFKNRVISLETETAMAKSLSRIEILGMKTDIEKNKLPPVGFIYIQYYGQPAPSTLWPRASWSDVSSTYAGYFFRAAGGGANTFGQTQSEFAPRITSVYFSNKDTHRHSTSISLNLGSTSDPITSGGWDGGWTGLKFYTTSGEVRPKNQAVLIFKRIS